MNTNSHRHIFPKCPVLFTYTEPVPQPRPQLIILYHTSLDREINRILSQRPITSRPQPMFSCHCKHLLASTHQRDAAFQAAMDRNNN